MRLVAMFDAIEQRASMEEMERQTRRVHHCVHHPQNAKKAERETRAELRDIHKTLDAIGFFVGENGRTVGI